MASPRITVILSVYGEAPYLPQFLDSLKFQTCGGFRLFCRFDGPPAPGNEALLRNFSRFAGFTADSGTWIGCTPSYGVLLQEACETSDCLLTADQDDVWDPDKIEAELAAVREAERKYGSDTPILVHSDLRVTDEALRVTAPSFMRYQALSPGRTALKDLMIQNNVTGCTVLMNRALARLTRIPEDAVCHDWYLALTAAAFGKIVYLDRPTVSYRQHGSNVYGAVPRRLLLKELFAPHRLRERLDATRRQAGAFLAQHGDRLSPGQRAVLEDWHACLNEPGRWKRLRTVRAHGLRKNDFLRTLGLWWSA